MFLEIVSICTYIYIHIYTYTKVYIYRRVYNNEACTNLESNFHPTAVKIEFPYWHRADIVLDAILASARGFAPQKEEVGSSLSTTRQRKCHCPCFMAGGPSLDSCEMSHGALTAEQDSLFRSFRDMCREETAGPGLGKAGVKCFSQQGSWCSKSGSCLGVLCLCHAGRILGLKVLL